MTEPARGDSNGLPVVIAMQGDAALLAGLHEACADDPWDAPAIARLLELPETVAYCAARGVEPCGLVLLRRAGEDCEILTVGVVPALRNRGIGAALLDTACDWALQAGVARVVLEVASNNLPALRLYAKSGFMRCGRRPDYYDGSPRRDALILEKPLGAYGAPVSGPG